MKLNTHIIYLTKRMKRGNLTISRIHGAFQPKNTTYDDDDYDDKIKEKSVQIFK